MHILSLTAQEFAHRVFSLFGKGSLHAKKIYSNWMRFGSIRPSLWAEPQALSLISAIESATDFSLPSISSIKEEGDTIKFLLKFADGLESESVIIPMESGLTLCLSSQVGCRMGCAFCETGRMGLLRNLSTYEIVAQYFIAKFHFKKDIRNIVFMGMGEPLDNYEAVLKAISILIDPAGIGLGPSRITLSTSGRVQEIYRLITDVPPALNLAISVNAADDLTRTKIMPINRRWNMHALKLAMQAYVAHPRRKILIEYVLIKDINARQEDAENLATYLEGLKVKVNVIPYNSQSPEKYAPPEKQDQELFIQTLRQKGLQALLRNHKGRQIMAACGQLGNVSRKKKLFTL